MNRLDYHNINTRVSRREILKMREQEHLQRYFPLLHIQCFASFQITWLWWLEHHGCYYMSFSWKCPLALAKGEKRNVFKSITENPMIVQTEESPGCGNSIVCSIHNFFKFFIFGNGHHAFTDGGGSL